MLSEQNIRDAIAEAVLNFDADAIAIDAEFNDAGLDSLDHASVLLTLQETHGLIVADDDIDQCNSIRAILEYAAAKGD